MIASVWTILCQLSPWLLFGMLISGLLHVLLPGNFVQKQFRGFWGVLKAVAIGVPLPLCSCGVIPAGIGLKNEGADDGAAVGFLISTPQTGVDSILVSVSFFGWPFAIFKMLAALVLGAIGGWFANLVGDETQDMKFDERASQSLGTDNKSVWTVWTHALEVFRSFWVWLVIGILISAAIENWVPDQWMMGIGALGVVPAMGLVLLVSVPLYVCATASVPLAAALVAGGFPPSAALVFLMAGPATNTTTIGAIYGRFGIKVLLIYLAVIVIGSMTAGTAFDWMLMDKGATEMLSGHSHQHWLSVVSAVVVIALTVYCASEKFFRASPGDLVASERTFQVSGMHCQNCAAQLSNALKSQFGAMIERVSFEPQRVVLQRAPDAETLKQLKFALKKLGYKIMQD